MVGSGEYAGFSRISRFSRFSRFSRTSRFSGCLHPYRTGSLKGLPVLYGWGMLFVERIAVFGVFAKAVAADGAVGDADVDEPKDVHDGNQ